MLIPQPKKDATIAEHWELYAKCAIPHVPKDAPQYLIMRRCFYAGYARAYLQFEELGKKADQALAMQILKRLEDEISVFAEQQMKASPNN